MIRQKVLVASITAFAAGVVGTAAVMNATSGPTSTTPTFVGTTSTTQYIDGTTTVFDDTSTTVFEDTTTTELVDPTTTEPFVEALAATDLVGQPVDGALMGQFLNSYLCEIDMHHYKCLYDGVELSSDMGLTVSSVFLYSQGVSDFDQYVGPLPYGLYWGQPRSEVEGAWGPPAEQYEPTGYGYDETLTLIYYATDAPWSTIAIEFAPETELLIKATFTE